VAQNFEFVHELTWIGAILKRDMFIQIYKYLFTFPSFKDINIFEKLIQGLCLFDSLYKKIESLPEFDVFWSVDSHTTVLS